LSEFIERQQPIIERSGMGLLPGVSLALFIAMAMIATVITGSWWVIGGVLAGIFAVTAAVIAVIFGLMGRDDDIYSKGS
jgi:hypothetical protein